MFLLCELPVLALVWFVSRQHRVHDRQHLAGDDDGFAGAMLSFDSLVELSHSRDMLSGRLGALG
jgi:hypothetical protein